MNIVRNRKIMMVVGIVIFFSIVILNISLFYAVRHEQRSALSLKPDDIDTMTTEEVKATLEEFQGLSAPIHIFYLIPITSFVGILIGMFVYYMLAEKVKQQDKYLKHNTGIILKLLSGHERKVIENLLNNGGKSNQYELSHLPGMNKFKAHRILDNLQKKGIVTKTRVGKVNRVLLDKELMDVLNN